MKNILASPTFINIFLSIVLTCFFFFTPNDITNAGTLGPGGGGSSRIDDGGPSGGSQPWRGIPSDGPQRVRQPWQGLPPDHAPDNDQSTEQRTTQSQQRTSDRENSEETSEDRHSQSSSTASSRSSGVSNRIQSGTYELVTKNKEKQDGELSISASNDGAYEVSINTFIIVNEQFLTCDFIGEGTISDGSLTVKAGKCTMTLGLSGGGNTIKVPTTCDAKACRKKTSLSGTYRLK